MQNNQPVNLNLFAMRFPISAISSILHRVTGILIFLALPFFLYSLELALTTEQQFAEIKTCMTSLTGKLFVWASLSAVLYHIIAGFRHILMDMGIGESKSAGMLGAKVVIVLSILVSVLLGAWLW